MKINKIAFPALIVENVLWLFTLSNDVVSRSAIDVEFCPRDEHELVFIQWNVHRTREKWTKFETEK